MPWRLIAVIVVIAVLLGFIGLNLDNTCDLSFGVKVLKGVPIYLTVFVSFMLGMASSLPFIIFGSLKKKMKKDRKKQDVLEPGDSASNSAKSPETSGPYGID